MVGSKEGGEMNLSMKPILVDSVMNFHQEESFKKLLERIKKKDVVHATDLLYCSKKKQFIHENPEKVKDVFLKPPVIHGKCFEKGLFDIVKKWAKKNDYDVRFWVKGRKELNGIKIVGEADIIIFEDGEPDKVIEVKHRVFSVEPTEHYLMQARLYGWLFNTREAYLWVFTDKGKTGYMEYDVSDEIFTTDDVKKLLHNYLNQDKCPMWDWECKYCQFKDVCGVYQFRRKV